MFAKRYLTLILCDPMRGLRLNPISVLEVGFFVGMKPLGITGVRLDKGLRWIL